ncbi:MAG: FtsX-like permease family protein, partial [Gemmataceae bacterium]|nr:FtsX-like permease family protein [Gemmataceae bacterium]
VSALFISVLQRKRELGLLRAVGATRGQILRSVLAEAVLMGAIGAAVGFVIGLAMEWYVINVMIFDESGFLFPMRIPWADAGLVMLGSVALATLAGLWPAYLATTLRIPEAIAYE